jgi:hypothetical protein
VNTAAPTHAPEPPLRSYTTASIATVAARDPVVEIARATVKHTTCRRNGSAAQPA